MDKPPSSEKEVVKDIINIVMDEELLHTGFDPEEPEDEVVREIVTLVTTGNKQTETNRPFEESVDEDVQETVHLVTSNEIAPEQEVQPSNTGAGSEATPSDSTSQVVAA
ncbi:hypothetical protein EOD39_3486 [Acipenser ruthenus]|uniref:Uncharacterized protein n=1 Tax=Acipenser ruthenus TaxID=7906 RepID=A0A444UMV6_ACIRT|nr:hypothetical protein EOD39_3486 [Acipenser ruthenus]